MLSEKIIRRIAETLEIPMLGLTGPEPLTECLPRLQKAWIEGQRTSFERVVPEVRIDFEGAFPGVKTVIVIGIPYAPTWPQREAEAGTCPRGMIAGVARGRDYHDVVTEKLEALYNALEEIAPGLKGRFFVDNTRLVDRGAAWRAGLGFFGKNNLLINPTYGSFFFIGQLLIDQSVDFKAVEPYSCRCEDCQRCLDACPGKALGDGTGLEPARCLSYLTQKKKLTDEDCTRFTRYLYGCDLCQLACPFNAQLKEVNWPGGAMFDGTPTLESILALSAADFEKTYGKTAAGWRGMAILKRNARILKNNGKFFKMSVKSSI